MDFISSKNIFLLTRDTLKLLNKEIMKHGSRTGYIFYMLLRECGGYEKFELAEWAMLGTLHDIGAYRTDLTAQPEAYELKNTMPHAVYGYLFFKYISPMPERAQTLLFHHLDYSRLCRNTYQYIKETELLSLAEKVDNYRRILGDKFRLSLLEKFRDTKFSAQALDLLYAVEDKYHLFARIDSEAFEKELDSLMDYIMFTNEEKKKYMEMLMYCLGFCSQNKVVDSVTTVCICEELATRLSMENRAVQKLYYGALLHDLGMLAIPSDIIDAGRPLTKAETELMRTHVEICGRILQNRMDDEVTAIALAHHERLDGSGYPGGIKEKDMSLSMKILQIADTITALVNERSYKEISGKADVLDILQKEVALQHFCEQVVDVVLVSYDEIMQEVRLKADEILRMNDTMEKQFLLICQKYGIDLKN